MSELELTAAEQALADELLAQIRRNEPEYQLTVGDRVYIKAIVANKKPTHRYISDGSRYPVFFDSILCNKHLEGET